jgi:hypothetical protein
VSAETITFWALWSLGLIWGLYLLGSAARDYVVHTRRPLDWERDFPEYRCPKDGHVKVVS